MAAIGNKWEDVTAPIGKNGPPEHYRIIRHVRVDMTPGTLHGKPINRDKHIYECECNYCGTHFEMNHYDINQYPFKSGCPKCKDRIKRDRRTAEFTEARVGSIIGGARCIRRVDGAIKHARYVFECPYCGQEFERTLSYMDDRAKEFEESGSDRMIDCGCQQSQYRHAGQLNRSDSIGGYASDDNVYYPIYRSRRGAILRCTDPSDANYENYGGRHINPVRILPPFYTGDDPESTKRDMEFMIKWSLENGWTPGCGLVWDHDNTNGNYELGNVRWVTVKINNNNRRKSLRLQYGDTVYDGSDARELLNVDLGRVRAGWSERRLRIAAYNALNPDNPLHYDNRLKRTVDNSGFIHMIPRVRLFPLYPDDWNGRVETYDEYVKRIYENCEDGYKSLLLKGWFHPEDFPGLDPINDPLLVWCKRNKSIRPEGKHASDIH